jgi:tRNA(Ile)-lysidine synthase
VRYAAFYETAEMLGYVTAIATAHNADDNAETVLFHLARGCGLDGLAGIPPVTERRVIRPLIHCTRDEIIAYCEGNTIPYIEDGTNADLRYTRNFIRHTVMKEMKEINPEFSGAVSRMCRTILADRELLDSMADEWLASSVSDGRADIQALLSLPASLLPRVLKRMHSEAGGENLAYVHVEAILEALRGSRRDKDLDLPGDIVFSLTGKWACFRRREAKAEFCYPLSLGENRFDDLKICIFLLTEEDNPKYDKNIYKLSTYQRINFDTINGKVFIRSRRDGDRYFTKKMTKSVKRWMCDSRIPRWMRDRVPLFCDESGIAYVRGMGLRDDLKTVPGCKVLHLYLLEEEPY